MRSAVLIAALIIPGPIQSESFAPVVISSKAIVQVVCFGKGTLSAGTAFRISGGTLLSVNHVTSGLNCYIDGKPIRVRYKSPKADFSMLKGGVGPYIDIDCDGFIKGRKYLAIGFARGLETQTVVELTGTGTSDDDSGQAILQGIFAVVPGQSGGPIIDEETGKVVGTVNAEDFHDGLSFSVPLSSTPVCKAQA